MSFLRRRQFFEAEEKRNDNNPRTYLLPKDRIMKHEKHDEVVKFINRQKEIPVYSGSSSVLWILIFFFFYRSTCWREIALFCRGRVTSSSDHRRSFCSSSLFANHAGKLISFTAMNGSHCFTRRYIRIEFCLIKFTSGHVTFHIVECEHRGQIHYDKLCSRFSFHFSINTLVFLSEYQAFWIADCTRLLLFLRHEKVWNYSEFFFLFYLFFLYMSSTKGFFIALLADIESIANKQARSIQLHVINDPS